ncbi:MAG TPA: DUF1697 domain-containing protein [Candidatus Acidoferrales bacterium]|nr:DUF1697 domain-containing protein [Candidatus Acidoferrales bacterium]
MPIVTFLRGVNVGGHRTFRPSILANQLRRYGIVNIGAAGTFVIGKPVGQTRLRSELCKRLPFETHIMMCTARELVAAALQNPFDGTPIRVDIVRFVAVLAKRPRVLPAVPIHIPSDGKWLVRILSCRGRFVFGCYRREMKAISHLGSIDTLFGAPATIRNWNTIKQVLNILEQTPRDVSANK